MDFDFVRDKLSSCGLGHLVPKFLELGIGSAAFRLLNDDSLDKLQLTFGERVILDHLKQIKEQEPVSTVVRVETLLLDPLPCTLDPLPCTSTVLEQPVILTVNPVESVECTKLREILGGSAYGKTILSLKRKLREKERRKICDIVINTHLKDNPKERVLPSQFKIWAQALSELFPKDPMVLFFSPHIKTRGHNISSTGALLNAYYGLRREKASVNDDSVSEEEDAPVVQPVPPGVRDALTWLETHLCPWETVLLNWAATSETRLDLLYSSKSSLKISEYIDKYKVLRQPQGYLLIKADFDFKFKNGDHSLANLDSFVEAAYKELKDVRPRSKDLKAIITQEEINLKSGNTINKWRVLLSLGYLVPCHNATKKKGKGNEEILGWRPTKQEVQNGFITLIDDVSKLQETVDRRSQKFLERKLTRQPFVILVGASSTEIEYSYVVIEDFFYKLQSPEEALDVCFKSFHAFNALYTVESRCIWLLIQTAVYNLFLDSDKKFASNSCLALLSKFNITLKQAHNIFVNHGSQQFSCSDCYRDYGTWKVFRQHLIQYHKLPQSVVHVTKGSHHLTSNPHNSSDIICESSNASCFESHDSFDSTCTESSSKSSVDSDAAKSDMNTIVNTFLNRLYSNKSIPRSFIQTVVSETSTVVSELVSYAQSSIHNILLDQNASFNTIVAVDDQLSSIRSPFTKVRSDYLRLSAFRNSSKWVEPSEHIVGDAEDFTASSVTPISVTVVYLPLSKSLKAFFEQPNIFYSTVSYINDLMSQPANVVSNFVQSKFWRSKVKDRSGIHIPIFLYSDSFQVNNSLGPHSDTGKLDGVYALIPVLPPSLRSSVDNIIVIYLFKSYDREMFTNAAVFQNLVEEFTELQSKGVTLNIDGLQHTVFFHLSLVIGDNLGMNSIFDFVSSFTANFCCRLCKIHRDALHFASVEDPSLLRNPDNYFNDVLVNDPSSTGIIRNSVWNDIPNFHVTENPSVDVMHDLLQGICHYDMAHIVKNLIKKGFFTLTELNFHIASHNYGCERGENKPTPVRDEALDKFHFKMSAKEMLCFVRNFSFMVGHLVPVNDPIWHMYILLRKILDIVLSPVMTDSLCDVLDSIVQEHNDLYVIVFCDTLKPKHHMLLHYGRIMRSIGPAINIWCMRCESKNRAATVAASATQSRKHICKTLAIREQICQVTRDINVNPVASFGKFTLCDIANEKFLEYAPHFGEAFSKSELFVTDYVIFKGIEYKTNNYVHVASNDFNSLPIFGKIHFILVNCKKDFLFLVQVFDTVMFCEHFHAFLLNDSFNCLSIVPEKLLNPYIYHGHFTNRCLYISTPHVT